MGEWVGRQAGGRASKQAGKEAPDVGTNENWLSGERWGYRKFKVQRSRGHPRAGEPQPMLHPPLARRMSVL